MEREYVLARSVLLDALEALDEHRDNLVLVGAQAVYQHTGDAQISVPPTTSDADLALNTAGLAEEPLIEDLLIAAGFIPGSNPGNWIGTGDVAVDLMVVPAQGNRNRPDARGANIPPHGRRTARIARGLEPALVDNAVTVIAAFDTADARMFGIRIAGPAALLIAKLIKISERVEQAGRQPDRLKEKDALDALRILQAVEIESLIVGIRTHLGSSDAAAVCSEALAFLRAEGQSATGRIPLLARAAALGDPTVAASFAVLSVQLLDAVHREGLDN